MYALAMYRRSLTPPGTLPLEEGLPGLADMGVDLTNPVRPSSGYGWSRWWRRGQSAAVTTEPPPPREPTVALGDVAGLDIARPASRPTKSPSTEITQQSQVKQYAKTLRLSSDQLVRRHTEVTKLIPSERIELETRAKHHSILRVLLVFWDGYLRSTNIPLGTE